MKSLLLILIFIASLAHGQIGGQGIYSFLGIPNSARVLALGGELLSPRDQDVNLFMQNPALLNDKMDNRLSLNYSDYFAGLNFGSVAYARKSRWGMIGYGVQYLNYGEFNRTDEFGEFQGKFTANDLSLNVAYAKVLDSLFQIGMQLKTIYSGYEQYNSFGIALDMGASYLSRDKFFEAGIAIRNAGFQIVPYTEGNREPLQWQIIAGITRSFEHVPLKFHAAFHQLQRWDITYSDPFNPLPTKDPLTGDTIIYGRNIPQKLMSHVILSAEFQPVKGFYLRLGYNYHRRQQMKVITRPGTVGISWGLGIVVNKYRIEYARSAYHLAGSPNQFTLSVNLNDFYKKK